MDPRNANPEALARGADRAAARRAFARRAGFLLLAAGTGLLILLRAGPGDTLAGQAAGKTAFRPALAWRPEPVGALDEPRLATGAALPRCRLEFEPQVRARIEEQVAGLMAREEGARVMTDADQRWFPAVLREADRAGEQVWSVQARLRGDLSNHWEGELRSWRVRLPRGESFHGLRELDFILPDDKAWCMEALANHLARRAGVLTLRDGFARLAVDERPAAVYYLCEVPSEEFLEAHGRPVSSIYRERSDWVDALALGKLPGQLRARNSPENFKVRLTPEGRGTLHAAALARLLAVSDLAELRAVLDVERYLALQALAVLAGTRHGLDWSNSYAYLDDSTGRFEPIPFDIGIRDLGPESARSLDAAVALPAGTLERILLASPPERARRDALLWSWVADGGADVLAAYDRLCALVLPEVQATADAARLEQVRERLDTYRERLRGNLAAIERALSFRGASALVRLGDAADGEALHEIEVSNLGFGPLALEGLSLRARYAASSPTLRVWVDSDEDGALGAGDRQVGLLLASRRGGRLQLELAQPLLVYSRLAEVVLPGTLRLFLRGGRFEAPPDDLELELRDTLSGRVLTADDVRVAVLDLSHERESRARRADRAEFLRGEPAFAAAEGGGVVLRAGEHRFERSVVVPEGVPARIEAGARLRFSPGASLVAFGPLSVLGTAAEPVLFEPARPGASWGALAVIGPHAEPSRIEHARLTGAAGGSAAGAFLGGGLSARRVELVLRDSVFEQGRSEDGVHLVSVRGSVERCRIRAAGLDALDLDGCDVSVRDCTFSDVDGDGLDLSGGTVEVLRCTFVRCADKGLSIGETSTALVAGCKASACDIGVAVKDGSRALLVGCELRDNRTGLWAYRKKAYFDGARALLLFSRLAGNQVDRACEEGSEVELCFVAAPRRPPVAAAPQR